MYDNFTINWRSTTKRLFDERPIGCAGQDDNNGFLNFIASNSKSVVYPIYNF